MLAYSFKSRLNWAICLSLMKLYYRVFWIKSLMGCNSLNFSFSIMKELSLIATYPFGYFLYKLLTTIGFIYLIWLIFSFSFRRSTDLLKFISDSSIYCLSLRLNFILSKTRTKAKYRIPWQNNTIMGYQISLIIKKPLLLLFIIL